MKIIKGDTVTIITGKDKSRTGEVIVAFPKKNSIIVKGLNMFKKHIKAQEGKKGGIVEKERFILTSKVILVCPSCKKTTRVGYKIDASGTKHHICKKCGAFLDTKATK
jgi:large subunit ribosomal protein L24